MYIYCILGYTGRLITNILYTVTHQFKSLGKGTMRPVCLRETLDNPTRAFSATCNRQYITWGDRSYIHKHIMYEIIKITHPTFTVSITYHKPCRIWTITQQTHKTKRWPVATQICNRCLYGNVMSNIKRQLSVIQGWLNLTNMPCWVTSSNTLFLLKLNVTASL